MLDLLYHDVIYIYSEAISENIYYDSFFIMFFLDIYIW